MLNCLYYRQGGVAVWLIKYYLKLQANQKTMSYKSSNKLWKSILKKFKSEGKNEN